MLYYKMKTEQIVMCVIALALGMLVANMLTNVCGCKTNFEGFKAGGKVNTQITVDELLAAAGVSQAPGWLTQASINRGGRNDGGVGCGVNVCDDNFNLNNCQSDPGALFQGHSDRYITGFQEICNTRPDAPKACEEGTNYSETGNTPCTPCAQCEYGEATPCNTTTNTVCNPTPTCLGGNAWDPDTGCPPVSQDVCESVGLGFTADCEPNTCLAGNLGCSNV